MHAKLVNTLNYKKIDIEKRLAHVEGSIDWASFPKDEYISPFTGEKT